MAVTLYIPWFRAETWHVPLPFELPLVGETLPIQPFGILVAIGVILGAKVADRFAAKNGLSSSVVADFVTHVVVAGFLGGYLLNAPFYQPETLMRILRDPRELFHEYLGLSSYGGFIGAIIGMLVWRARRKLQIMPIGDAAAVGFPFGWFFGRMGCFVVHDHPGRITDFPLAVADYRVGEWPYEPRHDLGLYEVFWSLAMVLLLVVLMRRGRRPGFYVALVPLLYAPVRFFLDYLRATPEEGGDPRYLGLTPGQYASVLLLLFCLWLMRYVYRTPAPTPPTSSDSGPSTEPEPSSSSEAAADSQRPGSPA